METKVKKYDRKAIFGELKEYCTFASDGDYIEVCEWKNGEGFDVEINNHKNIIRFQLTHGEFKLIKQLVKKLYKNE